MSTQSRIALFALLASVGAGAFAAIPAQQVAAELAEARRTGNYVAGESPERLADRAPVLFPKQSDAAGKTVEQVKAELAEAIRTGEFVSGGENPQKLNERDPQRYPKAAQAGGKTREQVRAEIAQAQRHPALMHWSDFH